MKPILIKRMTALKAIILHPNLPNKKRPMLNFCKQIASKNPSSLNNSDKYCNYCNHKKNMNDASCSVTNKSD